MDFRSAVPAAITVGAIVGAALGALNLPTPGLAAVPATEFSVASSGAAKWDIPVVRNEFVQRFVDLFTYKQSDRMALYLKRSGRYEGMIRTKLRERGMPEDLVYLSMIESGFNPNARSTAQAVGLWQFVAATGRIYGLRIDGVVDERRDPERSTDAALRYLQDLYNQFGSWNLAAAAYNSGENRVARIMREVTGAVRGTESDFWRIRGLLPSETREYVPLIFAAALIGKEPEKYGLEDVERLLPIAVETVEVPGGTSLDAVARSIGVDARGLKELNPQLIQGRTPSGQTSYPVRVPEGRGATYRANFAAVLAAAPPAAPATPAAAADTHRVSNGESLSVIAKRHGVSVSAIQRANGLGQGTTIQPGQVLRIPA